MRHAHVLDEGLQGSGLSRKLCNLSSALFKKSCTLCEKFSEDSCSLCKSVESGCGIVGASCTTTGLFDSDPQAVNKLRVSDAARLLPRQLLM